MGGGLFKFDFYIRDWFTATRMLSPAARGIYLDLFAAMYEYGGSIDADRRYLRQLTGLHHHTLEKILAELFEAGKIWEVDGKLFAKRVEEELRKVEKRRNDGRQGGRPPKSRDARNDAQQNVTHGVTPRVAPYVTPHVTTPVNDSDISEKQRDSKKAAPVTGHRSPTPCARSPANSEEEQISTEELYWQQAAKLQQDMGVAKSLSGKLVQLLNGDFQRGVRILGRTADKKMPDRYLAATIRRIEAEQADAAGVVSLEAHRLSQYPPAIARMATQGSSVSKDGKLWRVEGLLYDDKGVCQGC